MDRKKGLYKKKDLNDKQEENEEDKADDSTSLDVNFGSCHDVGGKAFSSLAHPDSSSSGVKAKVKSVKRVVMGKIKKLSPRGMSFGSRHADRQSRSMDHVAERQDNLINFGSMNEMDIHRGSEEEKNTKQNENLRGFTQRSNETPGLGTSRDLQSDEMPIESKHRDRAERKDTEILSPAIAGAQNLLRPTTSAETVPPERKSDAHNPPPRVKLFSPPHGMPFFRPQKISKERLEMLVNFHLQLEELERERDRLRKQSGYEPFVPPKSSVGARRDDTLEIMSDRIARPQTREAETPESPNQLGAHAQTSRRVGSPPGQHLVDQDRASVVREEPVNLDMSPVHQFRTVDLQSVLQEIPSEDSCARVRDYSIILPRRHRVTEYSEVCVEKLISPMTSCEEGFKGGHSGVPAVRGEPLEQQTALNPCSHNQGRMSPSPMTPDVRCKTSSSGLFHTDNKDSANCDLRQQTEIQHPELRAEESMESVSSHEGVCQASHFGTLVNRLVPQEQQSFENQSPNNRRRMLPLTPDERLQTRSSGFYLGDVPCPNNQRRMLPMIPEVRCSLNWPGFYLRSTRDRGDVSMRQLGVTQYPEDHVEERVLPGMSREGVLQDSHSEVLDVSDVPNEQQTTEHACSSDQRPMVSMTPDVQCRTMSTGLYFGDTHNSADVSLIRQAAIQCSEASGEFIPSVTSHECVSQICPSQKPANPQKALEQQTSQAPANEQPEIRNIQRRLNPKRSRRVTWHPGIKCTVEPSCSPIPEEPEESTYPPHSSLSHAGNPDTERRHSPLATQRPHPTRSATARRTDSSPNLRRDRRKTA